MLAIFVPGTPVGFARAGSKGSQRFTPPKQRAFMERVRAEARARMNGEPMLDGPLRLQIRASYLIPASWSKKRKAEAYWKTSTPDADNLSKIVKDALNRLVWKDDAIVVDLRVQKVFGVTEGVTITIEPLTEPDR